MLCLQRGLSLLSQRLATGNYYPTKYQYQFEVCKVLLISGSCVRLLLDLSLHSGCRASTQLKQNAFITGFALVAMLSFFLTVKRLK